MVVSDLEKITKDFASHFGINLKDIKLCFDNKIPRVQIAGKNETVNGLRNIVSQVSKSDDSKCSAIQDQWIEYVLTHVGTFDMSSASQMFKELNTYMANKVYFVGNQLGPVDILMYYLLYSVVVNLTFQDKEKFIHLSRWFNCVQNHKNTRLGRCLVPFSRTCLYV